MSEQTRRAFVRHFERALTVGNQATIADYLNTAEELGDPILLDYLNAARDAHTTAA